MNEKGSVRAAASLARSPEGFEQTVSSVLAGPGEDPARLRGSVRRFERLVEVVRGLCAGVVDGPAPTRLP